MSESAREVPLSKEIPKPGSLAAVRERIAASLVANAGHIAQEGVSQSDLQRAKRLHTEQLWQLGMLDALANQQAAQAVDTTGIFDPDKVALTMTAADGAATLQKWIEDVLDTPDAKQEEGGMSAKEAKQYAEDLNYKLIDEASRAS